LSNNFSVPTTAHSLGRRVLVGSAIFLCAAFVLAACGSGVPAAPPSSQGVVVDRPVPDIPLITSNGTPTSLTAYRGKYIVLANFLTLCQDECPLITGAFITLQSEVRAAGLGKKVVFMEITVDPRRDTPARLRAYSKDFGADWPLLTGTPANLNALWKFFGVSVQIVPEEKPPKLDWYTGKPLTYDVDHADGYILINRQGCERFVDANAPNLHGRLKSSLENLLNEGGVRNLRDQRKPNWTINDALSTISWLVGHNIPQTNS
jgi:protein SCO1/2